MGLPDVGVSTMFLPDTAVTGSLKTTCTSVFTGTAAWPLLGDSVLTAGAILSLTVKE